MVVRKKESRGRDEKLCGDRSTVLNKAVRDGLEKKVTVEEKAPQELKICHAGGYSRNTLGRGSRSIEEPCVKWRGGGG